MFVAWSQGVVLRPIYDIAMPKKLTGNKCGRRKGTVFHSMSAQSRLWVASWAKAPAASFAGRWAEQRWKWTGRQCAEACGGASGARLQACVSVGSSTVSKKDGFTTKVLTSTPKGQSSLSGRIKDN
eukprot:CAMPEP_0184287810 /NCGR_PEP_ID=MMETSP1049-20130417/206_1 /TAXON_ID=77928 /ORGANISM="Proteomonas sulcata, Strain CCMP704" /LENGTH=125 /DNA_ID=CAMNT_0026593879 /DNA_START=350 /DNA_END=727 /DNA_ORIENTATION=-